LQCYKDNQLQRTLDWNWQIKLARDAEIAYRRARPDERAWSDNPDVLVDWSPIARYERETGRR
jgi:hypothetical protein